jgi:23S rRNA (adenine2030-N6)-methyltransferase
LAVKDFPELARYFAVVRAFNRSERLDFYPGSPLIAHYFLRPQDRAWLYELHPQDYELLRGNVAKHRNIRVQHQDGFDGLKALLPPTSRRGLVLIDPSYEIKTDYDRVVQQVIKAHKKFSQGIYAIWYPVVDRKTVQKLEKTLIDSGIRNIQRFELGVSADTEQRGMTSSGMIVINPPWKLYDKLSQLLPRLAQQISQSDDQFFKCDYLVAE